MGADDYLAISFTQLKGGDFNPATQEYVVDHPDMPEKEIVYRVECSTDISAWGSGPPYAVRQSVVDQGATEEVTYRTATSLDDEPCQFMRVFVIQRDKAP